MNKPVFERRYDLFFRDDEDFMTTAYRTLRLEMKNHPQFVGPKYDWHMQCTPDKTGKKGDFRATVTENKKSLWPVSDQVTIALLFAVVILLFVIKDVVW